MENCIMGTEKSRISGIVAGIMALLISGVVVAEEKTLIKWSDNAPELEKIWEGQIKYENIDGEFCGVSNSGSMIITKELIPVNAVEKYVLSGTFKSLGEEPSKVFYGFRSYDKNKRHITVINALFIPGSATTLAQACKKGDKMVVIKANKKWGKNQAIAFDVNDDFSDLPNYKVDRIKEIVTNGDNLELQLANPVPDSYPAGTKVRAHIPHLGSYLYTTVCGVKMPKTWKNFSANATLGKPKMKMSDRNCFYPGTAYVKVFINPNYGKKKDAKLAFKNLTLKALPFPSGKN